MVVIESPWERKGKDCLIEEVERRTTERGGSGQREMLVQPGAGVDADMSQEQQWHPTWLDQCGDTWRKHNKLKRRGL